MKLALSAIAFAALVAGAAPALAFEGHEGFHREAPMEHRGYDHPHVFGIPIPFIRNRESPCYYPQEPVYDQYGNFAYCS